MDTLNPSQPTSAARGVSSATDSPATATPVSRKVRARRILRRVRQGMLLLLIAAATVATVWALRPKPIPVDVESVSRGPLVVAIEESGVTRVKDRYSVSVPVTGTLARVSLEPGDPVREGDTLAEIAPAASVLFDERTRAEAEARLGAALSALGQARAQEARALAAQELAAQELARVQTLHSTGSATKQSLDQALFLQRMRAEDRASALFATKVAGEEVRIARVALGLDGQGARRRHVDVLAPASGRVLRVHQKSSGLVHAGSALLEVADLDALEVVVDLLTTDAVQVLPGAEVSIHGWGQTRSLAGRVRRVEPSAFTRVSALGIDEQRVNVLIAVTSPRSTWAALGDGYHVQVRLTLWESQDVLRVPQGALFRHGNGFAVFRLEGNVARRVDISVGQRGEAEAEVLQGLTAGDQLIFHPSDRVQDGVRVVAR